MKKLITASLALFSLTPFTFADQPAHHSDHREHMQEKVEKSQEEFAKAVGLSDEQKSQLKHFRRQHHQEVRATKDDPSLTPDQKRERLMTLHRRHEEFLASILTPEQKTRWQEYKARHHRNAE